MSYPPYLWKDMETPTLERWRDFYVELTTEKQLDKGQHPLADVWISAVKDITEELNNRNIRTDEIKNKAQHETGNNI